MEFTFSINMKTLQGICLAAVALLNCEHDHWFAINKGESLIYLNADGLECLVDVGVVEMSEPVETIEESSPREAE